MAMERCCLDGVTFNDNSANGALATQGGGGLYNASGAVTITGASVISNNSATGAAGSEAVCSALRAV